MLRDYTLQQQIFSQYITKDKKENKQCTIVANPHKRNKYKRNVVTNDELVEKQYGLTKHELDTLIEQMAQAYNYQWKIVSNALYKEHKIIISDRALNFRYYKLHPRNQKCGYNQDEALQLIKLFYLEGKRYKEINQIFGYRGEHSIRNTLYEYSSKGFSKLQYYLRDQIMQLPKDIIIDKKRSRKAFLLQTLILNFGLKWDYNKQTLALFYFFIVSPESEISKVPKQLAMLLYKRFIQLIDEKKQQKKQMYELIKPNLYEQLEQVKQERNRLCANMFRIKKTKQRNKESQTSSVYSNQQELYGTFLRDHQNKPLQSNPANRAEDNNLQNLDIDQISIFSQEQQKSVFDQFDGLANIEEDIQNMLADIDQDNNEEMEKNTSLQLSKKDVNKIPKLLQQQQDDLLMNHNKQLRQNSPSE